MKLELLPLLVILIELQRHKEIPQKCLHMILVVTTTIASGYLAKQTTQVDRYKCAHESCKRPTLFMGTWGKNGQMAVLFIKLSLPTLVCPTTNNIRHLGSYPTVVD